MLALNIFAEHTVSDGFADCREVAYFIKWGLFRLWNICFHLMQLNFQKSMLKRKVLKIKYFYNKRANNQIIIIHYFTLNSISFSKADAPG